MRMPDPRNYDSDSDYYDACERYHAWLHRNEDDDYAEAEISKYEDWKASRYDD